MIRDSIFYYNCVRSIYYIFIQKVAGLVSDSYSNTYTYQYPLYLFTLIYNILHLIFKLLGSLQIKLYLYSK